MVAYVFRYVAYNTYSNQSLSVKICVGDTLFSAGIEGDMSRVEALDWDQTVSVLGSFAEERRVPRISNTSM